MKIIYVHGKLVSLGLGGVGSGCNRTLGGTLAVGGAHPPPQLSLLSHMQFSRITAIMRMEYTFVRRRH